MSAAPLAEEPDPGVIVSCEAARLDIDLIHRFLRDESTWAQGIARETVARSIRHSLCFGAYEGEAQVGFARVITDRATYAYLADVFTLPSHRGRGIGRRLVEAVLAHPELQGLRRMMLISTYARGLYAQYGWTPLESPERHMERRPGVTPPSPPAGAPAGAPTGGRAPA